MDDNPWVRRFRVDWTDAELDARIARPVGAVPDLSAMSADEAMMALQVALLELKVPSQQMREGIRRLHIMARAGCAELYPDVPRFLARVYALDRPPSLLPTLCLTGHSGNGKTELLNAFMRTLDPPSSIEIPNHACFRLVSAHSLRARSGQGFSEILEPVFPRPVKGKIYTRAQQQLARDGVGILVGDEVQFVTQTAGATKAANLIMGLAGLGPPLAYACNFSLLHSFLDKPQEQRDRLIVNVIVMEPDDVDGPDWGSYIDALLRVDKAFDELRARRDIAVVFHNFSYGNKRSTRRLVILSYGEARKRGSNVVAFFDLQKAYLSAQFCSAREDVEILSGRVRGLKGRKDLWCPIEAAEPLLRESRVRDRQNAREEEVARASLEASLTAEERSNAEEARKAYGNDGKPERPKRPKATAAAMAANATAYSDRKKRGSVG